MSWTKIVPQPQEPCECKLPNIDAIAQVGAGEGSEYQCPFCEKVWILRAGPSWEPGPPSHTETTRIFEEQIKRWTPVLDELRRRGD